MKHGLLIALGCLAALGPVSGLEAQSRQSPDDAWWTGPILANGAGTLTPGHWLVEPYVFDVNSHHANSYGSLTYILYGLANRFTIGAIPTVGFNAPTGGPSSSGVGLGDWGAVAQYRLTLFREGSWVPTTSVKVQVTAPTGKFDRLARPSDGIGGGTWSTSLGFNSQRLFWMPNGRILRARFNFSETWSASAHVDGMSVFGTGSGFRGTAHPGASFFAVAAAEYSLTRNWVLALETVYTERANTRVASDPVFAPLTQVTAYSGAGSSAGLAPAVEYNWCSNAGILLGARILPSGHNTPASVTPVMAINLVF